MRSHRLPLADRFLTADRRALSARPALAVILVGFALTVSGLAVAGPPLAVPGMGMVMLGALSVLWVLGVTAGLHVSARPLNATVIEGRQLHFEVTVGGPRLLGVGGAVLAHPLLDAPLPLSTALSTAPPPAPRSTRRPGLLPRRRARVIALSTRAHGRGRLTLAQPELQVSDPLGLARALRRSGAATGELLVLPRTESVHWLDSPTTRVIAHAQVAVAGPQAIDVVGLRDYQPGTPATRIHWPALARGGHLLELVYASEAQLAPLIVIDPRADGSDPAPLDAVLRAAASLTLALARAGAVDLLLPGRSAPVRLTSLLTGWPAAHRALALVVQTSGAAPPPQVPTSTDGVLFYACTDPARAAAARRRWTGQLLTLVPRDRAAENGSEAALEVADCVAVRPALSP